MSLELAVNCPNLSKFMDQRLSDRWIGISPIFATTIPFPSSFTASLHIAGNLFLCSSNLFCCFS